MDVSINMYNCNLTKEAKKYKGQIYSMHTNWISVNQLAYLLKCSTDNSPYVHNK
jgi:hypothetical protein